MNLFEDKDGGIVVVKQLTWIGPIRPVKVSKGKGKDYTETTVYNFIMKGGFQVFLSPDYYHLATAQEDHLAILTV